MKIKKAGSNLKPLQNLKIKTLSKSEIKKIKGGDILITVEDLL